MRVSNHFLFVALLAAVVEAQGGWSLPHLKSAAVGAAPYAVQSGGIAAYDVKIDEHGSVTSAEIVQDVQPYGAMLGDDVRGWRFEPARKDGHPAPSRVLVLGFFRPPELMFAAPEAPKYKSTVAPDEIPWPTAVTVPPYPPNALGSGKVVMEGDVSDGGAVSAVRVLSPPGAFDGAATQTLQQWRFRPAERGNRDVASRAFFVFSFVGTTP